jgi:hypothetical protein
VCLTYSWEIQLNNLLSLLKLDIRGELEIDRPRSVY